MVTIQESDPTAAMAIDATADETAALTAAANATTITTMDTTTDQDATDTDEVEELKNPQACFMGLPAELRVRIYGFLFSGKWVKADKTSQAVEDADQAAAAKGEEDVPEEVAGHRDESSHTEEHQHAPGLRHRCSAANPLNPTREVIHMKAPKLPLICPCFGPVFPAILRASKLVYNEAMPVFYSGLEVRACLPCMNGPEGAEAVFNDLLETLPIDGLKYVSQIVLCQMAQALAMTIERFDHPVVGHFALMWHKLRTAIPSVKHVRINLDLDWQIHMSSFEFQQLAGVASLPNVQTVQLQLNYAGKHNIAPENIVSDGGNAEDFEKQLLTTIEREAEKVERKVEVSVARV